MALHICCAASWGMRLSGRGCGYIKAGSEQQPLRRIRPFAMRWKMPA